MSIYESLGNRDAMSQLRADPAGMLKQAGYNIPSGMNDPNKIINHLLQTGQINNPKLQMLQNLAMRFKR